MVPERETQWEMSRKGQDSNSTVQELAENDQLLCLEVELDPDPGDTANHIQHEHRHSENGRRQ